VSHAAESRGRVIRATSQNANCRQFTILLRNLAHGVSERQTVFSEADIVVVVAIDRPT
jgi:hypothetical protein